MDKERSNIICPIFQKQEPVIKDITAKVNSSESIREKAEFAERLKEEVTVLLSCSDYDEKKLDCKNCHFISEMRKKTVNLIIKAKNIGK